MQLLNPTKPRLNMFPVAFIPRRSCVQCLHITFEYLRIAVTVRRSYLRIILATPQGRTDSAKDR
eukprot:12385493-Alexandrium_andersonii.AAC.1